MNRLYQLYAEGRDSLGLVFKRHRTHAAFELASKSAVAAWKQACADNSVSGNLWLPASVKAVLEVVGVGLIALYGLRRWRFVAIAATLLLAQTASEQQDTVETHDWVNDPEWNEEGQQKIRDALNRYRPGLGDQVDKGSRQRYLDMLHEEQDKE